MKIEHNSRLDFYRSPYGAVVCGTKVTLRLGVSGGGIPGLVRVHYNFNDLEGFYNMSYVYELGEFCIYEATLQMPEDVGLFFYHFEVAGEHSTFFYANNHERLGGLGEQFDQKPDCPFQITVYSKDYTVPEWFCDTIVYQIFPDRFLNGNEDNSFCGNRQDIIKRNWGETPFYKPEQFGGEYLSNDFFGGNFKGISKKIEYLAEMGVGAIYLNPIFKAYSNHRYDTGNYMQIDETLGTYEDFTSLCKKCDEFGIKIILDGVFNHTGSNSLYFNKNGEYEELGAYESKDSKYYSWYNFSKHPNEYESWWGMKTLPSVNETSEEYRDYIINSDDSVVKHWLNAGAYGWRLDVVDELPGFFVKELRRAVKSKNPDAIIIGEVWEDASNKISYGNRREYFLGEELDSVMNYPLRNAFIDLAKNNITSQQFDKRVMSLKENYPTPAFLSTLNMLSSHDVERILTIVSQAPDKNSVNRDFCANFRLTPDEEEKALKKVKQLVMMQMLFPGVPCIYYGDEIGMQGYNDPFCRRCFEWDRINCDLHLWHRLAIALRKSSDAFSKGDFESIYTLNYGYGFIRSLNDDKHIVCSNFGDKTEWFRLDLARFNIHRIENEIYEEYYNSEDGIYYIQMPPNEVKVFKGLKW